MYSLSYAVWRYLLNTDVQQAVTAPGMETGHTDYVIIGNNSRKKLLKITKGMKV